MPDTRTQFDALDIDKLTEGTLFHPEAPPFPHGHMRMVDRIPLISDQGGHYNKGVVQGELDIRADLWFFDCHFKNDPVMPGCLGLDAMWQLLGFYLAWYGFTGSCRALGAKDIRFLGQVLQSAKKVCYHLDIRRVRAKPFIQAIADGTMLVDGKVSYTVKGLHVGLFPSEIVSQMTGGIKQ